MIDSIQVLQYLVQIEDENKRFDVLASYLTSYVKNNYKSFKEIDVNRFVDSVSCKFPQNMLRFNYVENLRLTLQSLKDGIVPQEFKDEQNNQELNNIQKEIINQEANNNLGIQENK